MVVRSAGKRRDAIVHLATGDGLASVDALAEHFGVTASTIRRDLAELSSTGRIARTYGGAMALPLGRESSLNQRTQEAPTAKRAIGRWAADQIGDQAAVLLDGGTTVAHVARFLPAGHRVDIATTSVPVIRYLQGRDDVSLTCLGGRLRALSDAFVGPLAESALERMSFDVAFLGADGVTSDGAVCEAEPEQTRLKELMARRAKQVFLLVHSTKLNHRPFHSWARMDRHWTIVTDSTAATGTIDEFRAAGRDIIVVPPEQVP